MAASSQRGIIALDEAFSSMTSAMKVVRSEVSPD
jgi:hypothetical protein